MLIKLKIFVLLFLTIHSLHAHSKVSINAVGIPLADHYAAIVAYEKYKDKMQYADFHLKFLKSPDLVRAYFYSKDDVDMAFDVSPMVMEMFAQKPYFKWISLIHRDGNALAINHILNKLVKLNADKTKRKPDAKVADAIKKLNAKNHEPMEIAVPSILATHTTILYKYLKDYNLTMSLSRFDNPDVIIRIIKPPKSPAYLNMKKNCSKPAGFEQSMPWAEVAHEHGSGEIAWYSKDVMNTKNGHVECIIIARNTTIKQKRKALKEVIYYIHKAGRDIENARYNNDKKELSKIIKMIRKHIPSHTSKAIRESLRTDIMAINYKHLNITTDSKASFKEIMDLAYEAGFIKQKINIEDIADDSFNTIEKKW